MKVGRKSCDQHTKYLFYLLVISRHWQSQGLVYKVDTVDDPFPPWLYGTAEANGFEMVLSVKNKLYCTG